MVLGLVAVIVLRSAFKAAAAIPSEHGTDTYYISEPAKLSLTQDLESVVAMGKWSQSDSGGYRPRQVNTGSDALQSAPLLSPPLRNTAGRAAARAQGKRKVVTATATCEGLEAEMLANGAWTPEALYEARDRSEWVRLRCWDPNGKPANWSDSWPTGVCKRYFWRRESHGMGDKTHWVFRRGAMSFGRRFHRPTPLIRLPEAPRSDSAAGTAMEDAAIAHMHTIYAQECSVDTPIMVFPVRRAGLSLEINAVLRAVHAAIVQRRALVITRHPPVMRRGKRAMVPKPMLFSLGTRYEAFEDLVRASKCQEMIGREHDHIVNAWLEGGEEDALHSVFSNLTVLKRSISAATIAKNPIPKEFDRLGLVRWMRLLARYFVRPSDALKRSALARAGIKDVQLRKSRARALFIPRSLAHPPPLQSIADKIAPTLFGSEARRNWIGVHARVGDSCEAMCRYEALFRPRHCVRSIGPYLDLLRARGIVSPGRRTRVYVATDSSQVVASISKANGDQRYAQDFEIATVTSIEREKYGHDGEGSPIARKQIERRDDLDPGELLEDLIVELAALSASSVVVGSLYSNVPRLALVLGPPTLSAYISLDTIWCFNVGCAIYETPAALSLQAFAETYGFSMGVSYFLQSKWDGKADVIEDLGALRAALGPGGLRRLLDAFKLHSTWDNKPWDGTRLLPSAWKEDCVVEAPEKMREFMQSVRLLETCGSSVVDRLWEKGGSTGLTVAGFVAELQRWAQLLERKRQ